MIHTTFRPYRAPRNSPYARAFEVVTSLPT